MEVKIASRRGEPRVDSKRKDALSVLSSTWSCSGESIEFRCAWSRCYRRHFRGFDMWAAETEWL